MSTMMCSLDREIGVPAGAVSPHPAPGFSRGCDHPPGDGGSYRSPSRKPAATGKTARRVALRPALPSRITHRTSYGETLPTRQQAHLHGIEPGRRPSFCGILMFYANFEIPFMCVPRFCVRTEPRYSIRKCPGIQSENAQLLRVAQSAAVH